MSEPTPTTVGELAILVVSMRTAMNEQFSRINAHLEKLDGLPLKVQALEFRVDSIEKRGTDRRFVWFTILGWAVALGAGLAGVIVK